MYCNLARVIVVGVVVFQATAFARAQQSRVVERPRCGTNGEPVGRPAGRETTARPFWFDVVPCAVGKRDAPPVDSSDGAEAAKQAATFIAWIAAHSRLAVHVAPSIRLMSAEDMQKMYNPTKAPAILTIIALYAVNDHVVYLRKGWNSKDLRDRSALLHELVHHLQFTNDVKFICPQDCERQAFELQIDWLREQGIDDPFDFLGISPFFIYMLSHCPEF